jgi:hypothetical protein
LNVRATFLTLFVFAAMVSPDVACAQVETIVVTAHIGSPAQEALYKKLHARLTDSGKIFVADEGKRLHFGAITVEAAERDAARDCSTALPSCSGNDSKALAFLVLGKSLSWLDPQEFSRLFTGIPQPILDHASARAESRMEKGDMKGAKAAWLAVLPPDRRAAVIHMWQRNKKVRAVLSRLTEELKT